MGLSLIPDYLFDHFYEASPEFLKSIGIKAIILDIDNTLEPYENAIPGERVLSWLKSLKDESIGCAFVSNNGRERVELFNKQLDLPAYYKAGKPFTKNVYNAMRDLSSDKSNTILMGDQIFTDVWAARNAGIRAILVPPINDKKDIFTKFKRLLEKPILKSYEKRKNI